MVKFCTFCILEFRFKCSFNSFFVYLRAVVRIRVAWKQRDANAIDKNYLTTRPFQRFVVFQTMTSLLKCFFSNMHKVIELFSKVFQGFLLFKPNVHNKCDRDEKNCLTKNKIVVSIGYFDLCSL